MVGMSANSVIYFFLIDLALTVMFSQLSKINSDNIAVEKL